MVQTVMSWAEDEDRGATGGTGLASIADLQFISGTDKHLQPVDLPHFLFIYCATEKAAYVWVDGWFVSPNINGVGVNNLRLHQGFTITRADTEGVVYDFAENPFPGVPGQEITAWTEEADEAGQAHFNNMNIILGDRRHPYRPKPPITHIASGTVPAVTAMTWTSGTITLDDSLPSGLYRFHGADIASATIFAARFTGLMGATRPPAIIPRRLAADPIHPFNYNIGGGIPYMMDYRRGGALPVKTEILAETTDTPLNVTLFLQKVG